MECLFPDFNDMCSHCPDCEFHNGPFDGRPKNPGEPISRILHGVAFTEISYKQKLEPLKNFIMRNCNPANLI